MPFYYEATSHDFLDGSEKLLCSSLISLEKKDIVVLELRERFVTARIQNSVEELSALLSDEKPIEIIQKIEIRDYLQKKENKTKRLLLINEMEEKCKEVKLMETLKKYSERDEEMKSLYDSYFKLSH